MGTDSTQHKKKKISNKPIKKERDSNHSKDIDRDSHGIRIGYHSEAAKMPKYEEGEEMGYHSEAAKMPKYEEGEEMGYHSEAAKMPKYEEGEGMNIGYHSEAANVSSHKDRLHDNKDSLTEQHVDDDNVASDQ
jgi:hypothetical protein